MLSDAIFQLSPLSPLSSLFSLLAPLCLAAITDNTPPPHLYQQAPSYSVTFHSSTFLLQSQNARHEDDGLRAGGVPEQGKRLCSGRRRSPPSAGCELFGAEDGVCRTSGTGLQAQGSEGQDGLPEQLQEEEERCGVLLPQGQHARLHQGSLHLPGRPREIQEGGGRADRDQQRRGSHRVRAGERIEHDPLERRWRQGTQGVEGEGRRIRRNRWPCHVRPRQAGRCDQHVRQPPRRRCAQQGGAQGSRCIRTPSKLFARCIIYTCLQLFPRASFVSNRGGLCMFSLPRTFQRFFFPVLFQERSDLLRDSFITGQFLPPAIASLWPTGKVVPLTILERGLANDTDTSFRRAEAACVTVVATVDSD